MTRRPALPLALSALLLLPAPALAAEAPAATATTTAEPKKGDDVPLSMKSLKLKLSGMIFASWGYDVAGPYPDATDYDSDTEGANRFDISRAYLNVEPQLGEKLFLRITPDITRVSDKSAGNSTDGNLAFRLKYAYVTFADVLPGVALKAGQQQTAWIDFEDSIWKQRVLGPVGYETFTGMASADTGVGVLGKHADGLLEYQLVLSNGEGYTKPESSQIRAAKYKDGALRLTLAPLVSFKNDWTKGLKLSVFHQYGITRNLGENHDTALRLRTLGMLTWETKWFALGAGGGPTTDGEPFTDDAGNAGVKDRSGLLVESFGVVYLPYDLRLLGRLDWYDPNVDLSPVDDPEEDKTTGVKTRTILGVGYQVNELVAVIANYQLYGYEEPANTKRTDPGSTFFVHLDAKY